MLFISKYVGVFKKKLFLIIKTIHDQYTNLENIEMYKEENEALTAHYLELRYVCLSDMDIILNIICSKYNITYYI